MVVLSRRCGLGARRVCAVLITEIHSEATLELRQKVLWPNESCDFCRVEGDEQATHYGAYSNDVLIGVASVYEHSGSVRLRKFAVEEEHQGNGIGSAMLTHITFWCDARQNATEFYERFGLRIEGDSFYKSGIAYYRMTLELRRDIG